MIQVHGVIMLLYKLELENSYRRTRHTYYMTCNDEDVMMSEMNHFKNPYKKLHSKVLRIFT